MTSKAKVARCSRCDRRFRNQPTWNATVKAGRIVGVLCADCQTPEENAEAEINEATLEYAQNERGQLIGRPRAPDLLTPSDWHFVDADQAAGCGLPGVPHCLVSCEATDGYRVTLATKEVDAVEAALVRSGLHGITDVPRDRFSALRAGWPADWPLEDGDGWHPTGAAAND